MPVAFRVECGEEGKWVLNGLLPPECDQLLLHLPDEENLDGVNVKPEMCVVATLATLLHQRGISLDERTVNYLHGRPVLFGHRWLDPPTYALTPLFERARERELGESGYPKGLPPRPPRVELLRCVKDFGWDETADYLAEQQERLRFLATARRPKGRPKDEEFDQWASTRFAELRNVGQVVKEAVAKFGLRRDAARKRITRADWFHRMPAAPATTAHRPAPSPRSETGSRSLSLVEVIEKYIRANGPREDRELAAELGFGLREVKKSLQDQDRFQYRIGNKWDVFR